MNLEINLNNKKNMIINDEIIKQITKYINLLQTFNDKYNLTSRNINFNLSDDFFYDLDIMLNLQKNYIMNHQYILKNDKEKYFNYLLELETKYQSNSVMYHILNSIQLFFAIFAKSVFKKPLSSVVFSDKNSINNKETSDLNQDSIVKIENIINIGDVGSGNGFPGIIIAILAKYIICNLTQDEVMRNLAQDEEMRNLTQDEEMRNLTQDEEMRNLAQDEEIHNNFNSNSLDNISLNNFINTNISFDNNHTLSDVDVPSNVNLNFAINKINFFLIEPSQKKADFLKIVNQKLKLNLKVLKCSIQECKNIKFDILISRAFSSKISLLASLKQISFSSLIILKAKDFNTQSLYKEGIKIKHINIFTGFSSNIIEIIK